MRLAISIFAFFLVTLSWTVQSKTIVLGTSDGPPYMIRENDSGMDLDITRIALEQAGYEVSIQYMSLEQSLMSLYSGTIDAAVPMFVADLRDIYFSSPHVYYTPGVYSLTERDVKVDSVSSLKHYRVGTFQGAKGYFGKPFIDAVGLSPQYFEHSDMSKLVTLLHDGHIDLVVLDYNIFFYFWNREYGNVNSKKDKQPITFHPVIDRVTASVAFTDPSVRDDFNQALDTIKQDGTYREILNKYQQYGVPNDYPIP